MAEIKGLNEQERLTLLTAQLNFLSCNTYAFSINHEWLKNTEEAEDLRNILKDANDGIEKIVDEMILKLDAKSAIDDLQRGILKPIHKALAIKD